MAFAWFKRGRKTSEETGAPEPGAAMPAEATEGAPRPENGRGPEPPEGPAAAEPPRPASAEQTDRPAPAEPKRNGFLSRLKRGLSKTREILSTDIDELFTGRKAVDEEMLEDLEELLITADIGVKTTMELVGGIGKRAGKIGSPQELKQALKEQIREMLPEAPADAATSSSLPHVVMVIGVNGVGKTTTIGKLAARATARGMKVLIAAGDTFRAAAADQLAIWAERAGAEIIRHKENSDPAAVAFDAVVAAQARGIDLVLVDTAGRLHTKVNLMEELKKIKRSIAKQMPDAPHEILLVLDATTGQNALSQARLFNEAMEITGIALTKLDGTAKGGIVVSICRELNLPLHYIGVGEQIDDLQDFDPDRFVEALI